MCVPFAMFVSLPFQVSYDSNMDVSDGSLKIDFGQSICISEVDLEEDFKESSVPPDLLQLVEQEEKQIMPYKDLTKVINLGTQGD